jgi:hypothetical protein
MASVKTRRRETTGSPSATTRLRICGRGGGGGGRSSRDPGREQDQSGLLRFVRPHPAPCIGARRQPGLPGPVEGDDEFHALARHDHHLVHRNRGLDQPAIGADEEHARAREAEAQVPGIRRVDEADAALLSRRHGQDRVLLSIDQDMVADAAVHGVGHGARGHRSIGGDAQIGEHQEGVAVGGRNGIDLRLDQEHAREAAIDLLGREIVRVRMKPVGRRAALGEIEGVEALVARGDRVHGVAVLIGRDRHPVPVDRGGLPGNAVPESDRDAVAFRRLDHGLDAVIEQDGRREPLGVAHHARARRDRRAEATGHGRLVRQARQVAQGLPLRQDGHRRLRDWRGAFARHRAHVVHHLRRGRSGADQPRETRYECPPPHPEPFARSSSRPPSGLYQNISKRRHPEICRDRTSSNRDTIDMRQSSSQ